jgi:BirA family transcriptional regulator, biotin operon repressor / biotin---[acetyl-CoA-carboxylase] ligase
VSYDGHAPDALAAHLRLPHLIVRAEVVSTLDDVHALAETGAPAGTIVLADAQTRGRGRQGRAWQSPAGRGIWLGYLVRAAAEPAALLGVRAGLAVARALGALGVAARVKWPNDVLVDGRKVCGILCETRWREGTPRWSAVGIGINVHGPVAADLAGTAAALDAWGPVTRVAVLERLMPHLRALPTGPVLDATEREEWDARDWLAGRRIVSPLAGVARGIAPDGSLRIETPDGMRSALAGHVTLA